jgi:hypothetical protein
MLIAAIPERERTLPRVMVEQGERLGAKPYFVFTHEADRPITFGAFAAAAENAG